MDEPVASPALTVEVHGAVTLLHLDDGKANVISHGVIDAFHAALDRVEADRACKAVVIAGRTGQFSGGFDLKEFAKGAGAVRDLVIAGGALCNRLLVFPRVTVTAVTGNAVAAGAILTMACDWNVGAEGSFRMGLPETAISMSLPVFAIELARHRLHVPHFTRATLLAEMYDPAGALTAGYLDEVVGADEVIARALAKAETLTELSPAAVARTKRTSRAALHELIGSTLVADVTGLTTDPSPDAGR